MYKKLKFYIRLKILKDPHVNGGLSKTSFLNYYSTIITLTGHASAASLTVASVDSSSRMPDRSFSLNLER